MKVVVVAVAVVAVAAVVSMSLSRGERVVPYLYRSLATLARFHGNKCYDLELLSGAAASLVTAP